MNKNGLRILWMSNAPWCPTGYGVQANKIIPFLKSRAEVDDVGLFAYYGIQGGVTKQKVGNYNITCYPLGLNPYGNDVVNEWVKDFKADILITLLDVFITSEDFGTQGFYWLPYAPIDHDPLPQAFVQRFRNAYKPIVYSKFAQKKMNEAGLEFWYAPHGVETNIFKPYSAADRKKAREWLGLTEDTFVVGMVAANKDHDDRKGFNQAMAGFYNLVEKYPDCELYLHSLVTPEMGGYDLIGMAQTYGIIDKVRFTLREKILMGLAREDMVNMYNAFDVLLNPCHRAGFEIPLIESQACGVPVICGDWHSMTELCGSGWLVEAGQKRFSPLGSFTYVPSVTSVTECLMDAYENKGNSKHQQNARDFAMEYDWKYVLGKYWGSIVARLDDELSVKDRLPVPAEEIRMMLNRVPFEGTVEEVEAEVGL